MSFETTFKKRTPLSNRRLLIIDGSRGRFADFATALKDSGFEVFHIDDKDEAIKHFSDIQPDIVLVNLMLRGASSIPLIKQMRAQSDRLGTRILVLTSHKSKENLAECVAAGAHDFILEPFDSRLLMQRVRYQLQDREVYSPEDLRAEPTQVLAGFQLVYETLKILAEIKDAQRSIFEVLRKIAALSGSTRVNLIQGDIASDTASIVATSDDMTIDGKPVSLEKYPEVREVLLNGNIVYIKDIAANPLTKDISRQVKSIEITSILVFPIRHRAETIGTLNIRLGKDGLTVSDKHLKTFYMIALALSSKVAARRLLKRIHGESTE